MTSLEGNNIGRPPLLEGRNFGYWKSRMRAFIKSIDELAWDAVEEEWTSPTMESDGETIPKPKNLWSEDEKKAALYNSRAINAIFAAMDEKNFKLITNCTSAKKAWETLITHHEGTSRVRENRLQMITAKFEQLRMGDHESVADFNARLMDVANESAALGHIMSDETLVRKTLRSLPKSYNMKVCSISDSCDLSKLTIDDLMGSLRLFEQMLNNHEPEKKPRNIGLKAEVTSEELSEEVPEDVAMLVRREEIW